MALFDAKIQQQLKDVLSNMKDEVQIINFTQEIECPMCRETRQFVEEIGSLSDRLKVKIYNFVTDKEMSAKFKIDKIPAIVLLDKDGVDHGIRFFGLPGGYEINSFLGSIIELSGKREPIPDDVMNRIKAVDRDVHIQVFVGLGCPHCPAAVSTAHRLAMENSRIKADMIDAGNFVPLSQKYNVTGVPKIVINDKFELMGAHPVNTFLDVIDRLKEISLNID
ncbi:MAG TPA: thioredoxin family protein [Spirochaetota bacterium]|nr:thioredoxin family protein [Spirochaetota bacterium]HPF05911.1 thioredoxin family protein [Spirochaetota bacterium]HPJ42422.1 thioredoxin family protein [Spirochaetota bacterium]HPR37599.1 thioredoxin family protein [Spirochaetota bacterium]HRX46789.1 thioredoxin family protein [Spirochaetota bacterium]